MAGVRDECDLIRHAFFRVPGDWTPPYEGQIETVRCERCGTERRSIFQRNTGALLYRRYIRTEGWVNYPKNERPSIEELRLGWINQQITEARKARNGPRKKKAAAALHGVQAVSSG